MTPNNRFSNNQLNVFRTAGWFVYAQHDESMVQIIKYSDTIPIAPILIQLDYKHNTLLVIEQNIFNYREPNEPRYNATLPQDVADTIQILNLCKAINVHHKERLHANRFDA